MKEWKEPYFLTLTVKACNGQQLKAYINSMLRTFQKIIEKHRKKNQRSNGKKLVGVKSLESNFNPVKKTYNPHFHVITEEKWMAEVILEEWLSRSKKGYTLRCSQNLQPVRNLETGLIEIIKYGTKIFTEPDLKKKAKERDTAQIYLKALDTILSAMKGKRIFDRFGFNAPKNIKPKYTPAKLLSNYIEWEFNTGSSDWIDNITGEVLTQYKIPSHLQAILTNNINTTLE